MNHAQSANNTPSSNPFHVNHANAREPMGNPTPQPISPNDLIRAHHNLTNRQREFEDFIRGQEEALQRRIDEQAEEQAEKEARNQRLKEMNVRRQQHLQQIERNLNAESERRNKIWAEAEEELRLQQQRIRENALHSPIESYVSSASLASSPQHTNQEQQQQHSNLQQHLNYQHQLNERQQQQLQFTRRPHTQPQQQQYFQSHTNPPYSTLHREAPIKNARQKSPPDFNVLSGFNNYTHHAKHNEINLLDDDESRTRKLKLKHYESKQQQIMFESIPVYDGFTPGQTWVARVHSALQTTDPPTTIDVILKNLHRWMTGNRSVNQWFTPIKIRLQPHIDSATETGNPLLNIPSYKHVWSWFVKSLSDRFSSTNLKETMKATL
jgi:hypothetical protein